MPFLDDIPEGSTTRSAEGAAQPTELSDAFIHDTTTLRNRWIPLHTLEQAAHGRSRQHRPGTPTSLVSASSGVEEDSQDTSDTSVAGSGIFQQSPVETMTISNTTAEGQDDSSGVDAVTRVLSGLRVETIIEGFRIQRVSPDENHTEWFRNPRWVTPDRRGRSGVQLNVELLVDPIDTSSPYAALVMPRGSFFQPVFSPPGHSECPYVHGFMGEEHARGPALDAYNYRPVAWSDNNGGPWSPLSFHSYSQADGERGSMLHWSHF